MCVLKQQSSRISLGLALKIQYSQIICSTIILFGEKSWAAQTEQSHHLQIVFPCCSLTDSGVIECKHAWCPRFVCGFNISMRQCLKWQPSTSCFCDWDCKHMGNWSRVIYFLIGLHTSLIIFAAVGVAPAGHKKECRCRTFMFWTRCSDPEQHPCSTQSKVSGLD